MRFAGIRGLWLTYWSWPFGGGEEAFYANAQWCSVEGMQVYWLAFCDSSNCAFATLKSIKSWPVAGSAQRSEVLQVPGNWSVENVLRWVRLLRPHFIHHQGHRKDDALLIAQRAHLPLLSGFHFWHGALELAAPHHNAQILQHASEHSAAPQLCEHLQGAVCYVASEFMQECIETITGHRIERVCYPLSDWSPSQPRPRYRHHDGDTVTMINVHAAKGGELLLHLLHEPRPQHLSFVAIQTEAQSKELDAQLEQAIAERLAPSRFLPRQADLEPIYAKTGVLLVPSLVDETFCRVALEGAFHGIPVLASSNGFLQRLVPEPLPADQPERWVRALLELTSRPAQYAAASCAALATAQRFGPSVARQQLFGAVDLALTQPRRIALLTPWCDQGLGVQSRVYAELLEARGWECSVFAFCPYYASAANPQHQARAAEWSWPRIYYSPHDREHVEAEELRCFVQRYRVQYALIPETCFAPIFDLAAQLRALHVTCCAVPNFEIVRRDELWKHEVFASLLCNNQTCYDLFAERAAFPQARLHHIGFALPPRVVPQREARARFLFFGGMNAFSRKCAAQVYEAYRSASARNPRIALTMCIQSASQAEQLHMADWAAPNLCLVQRHLSRAEVEQLYAEHTINVQVSRHEGLGLGFYEALAWGLPTLTLDHVPHNEIIQHNATGWLVPCTLVPMTENAKALTCSAQFRTQDLCTAMLQLAHGKRLARLLQRTAQYAATERYAEFGDRLEAALLGSY